MKVIKRSPLVERALVLLRPDWAAAWHELGTLTNGMTDDDPRYPRIMTTLSACDDAFRAGNWCTFRESAEKVKLLVKVLP